ncbi:hypothetical protein D1872_203630 [compost metagenome]
MSKYQWKDEPESEAESNMKMYAYYWVLSQLSQEEQDRIINEYREYAESEHEKGKAIAPAYIWLLKRTSIKVGEVR